MSSKIMSQSISLFTNPKLSVDSNSKAGNTSNDFTSVMDKSLKAKQVLTKKDDYFDKKAIKKSENNDNTQKTESQNVGNATNTTYTNDIKNVSNETASNSVTDTNESENVLNEAVQGEVKKLFTTIQNTLTEGLDLTKEELEKQLELLGFTMFDMLNMDNLKQLILSVNGASDITDVLTNETLSKTLQSITFAVEEIVQDNELNLSADKMNELYHQVMDEASINNLDKKMEDYTNEEIQDVKGPDIQVVVENDDGNQSTDLSGSSKEGAHTTDKNNSMLDTIMNNLSGVNNENLLNLTEVSTKGNEIRQIVSQIVEQIKILIKPEQTSMELQLNPEHLGKLQLSVVSKEGVLTAQFTTPNQAVKEAIESQMQFLKDNLMNQGLKVDAIEVTVSNFEFAGSNEAQNENSNQGNSKKRRFINDDVIEVNNVSEESVRTTESNELNGTTVDYSA